MPGPVRLTVVEHDPAVARRQPLADRGDVGLDDVRADGLDEREEAGRVVHGVGGQGGVSGKVPISEAVRLSSVLVPRPAQRAYPKSPPATTRLASSSRSSVPTSRKRLG